MTKDSIIDLVKKYLFPAEVIEKSLVVRENFTVYYAIAGRHVLDLGLQVPPDAIPSQDATIKTLILVCRDYGNIEVQEIPDVATAADVNAQAVTLAEDNRNDVRWTAVATFSGYSFANRPVYVASSVFRFISKSEQHPDEKVVDFFQVLDAVEKAGTQTQSILFPKDKYSVAEARTWLTEHNKKHDKVDTPEKGEYHHFRQFDPDMCSTTPKTISLGGSGIKARICVKKSEDTMKDEEFEKAEMTRAAINDLPDSDFAYIEPGGEKDEEGKTKPRSLRHFPVHDKAHARNALQRAPQSPFGQKAMPKILAACKRFGIEVAEKTEKFEFFTTIKKSDFAQGLIYGVVYEPNAVDTQGDFTSPEEIEKAAHNFLAHSVLAGEWTDKEHTKPIEKGGVEVVECYIAPVDFMFDTEPVKKGSWVLVTRIIDEDLKKEVEGGEIRGYSLEGTATRISVEA